MKLTRRHLATTLARKRVEIDPQAASGAIFNRHRWDGDIALIGATKSVRLPPESTMVSEKGFAVIYRWSVAPEHEHYFRQRWQTGTLRLKRDFGSLGSCLTRAANGDFIAFARWPSEAAREQAFASIAPLEPWPGILTFEETKLEVEEDLLVR